jgi:hypothetical protein
MERDGLGHIPQGIFACNADLEVDRRVLCPLLWAADPQAKDWRTSASRLSVVTLVNGDGTIAHHLLAVRRVQGRARCSWSTSKTPLLLIYVRNLELRLRSGVRALWPGL